MHTHDHGQVGQQARATVVEVPQVAGPEDEGEHAARREQAQRPYEIALGRPQAEPPADHEGGGVTGEVGGDEDQPVGGRGGSGPLRGRRSRADAQQIQDEQRDQGRRHPHRRAAAQPRRAAGVDHEEQDQSRAQHADQIAGEGHRVDIEAGRRERADDPGLEEGDRDGRRQHGEPESPLLGLAQRRPGPPDEREPQGDDAGESDPGRQLIHRRRPSPRGTRRAVPGVRPPGRRFRRSGSGWRSSRLLVPRCSCSWSWPSAV